MHFFLCTYSLVGGKKLQKYDLVEFYCKKKVKNSRRRSIVVKYLINTEKKKKLEILMDLNVKSDQMQLCN